MSSDRNLLFGILALQMDFISRDKLIRAMSTWAVEKQKRLGDILTENGWLAEDEHQLLEAMVRKHLEKHDNDAEKSLAALSSIGPLRGDLESIGSSNITESVTRIPALSAEQGATMTFGESSSHGERFTVLRPHASGGLGQVSVALDRELNREVALKEIKPGFADDVQSRDRFTQEAEVTGRLEHPGIVPVYGLGKQDDGRPFYAMRLIQGDSLKEAVERHHKNATRDDAAGRRILELRNLLRRFVDVCNAIQYAHSRGVLHRDLKPSNVMLGNYGETLVVDWGLAKVIGQGGTAEGPRGDDNWHSGEGTLQISSGSGSTPTQAGATIGTPAYMSPEQASGRLDKLGPQSDVYCLGATLYNVLTGQPPVAADDVATILKRVERGEFPSPKEVHDDVPLALNAVCLKAMARNPADRYPDPHGLADDVERWLADEPVSAFGEAFSVRLGRWTRRHRTAVMMATSALVVSVVGLVIGTAMLTRANKRIRHQREVALANEKRAERNFQHALGAVNELLTGVSENELLDVPGMHPLRNQLLERALRYYLLFVVEENNGSSLTVEVIDAYQKIGRIKRRLGRVGEARHALENAASRLQPFVESADVTRSQLSQFVDILLELAEVERDAQATDKARAVHVQCINHLEAWLETNQDDVGFRRKLATVHGSTAKLEHSARSLGQARSSNEEAIRICRELSADDPEDDTIGETLAGLLQFQGVLLREAGDVPVALATFAESIEIQERLHAARPTDVLTRVTLAANYHSYGIALRYANRPKEAVKSFGHASKMREDIVRDFPSIPAYRAEFAATLNSLGVLSWAQQDFRKALDFYRRAQKLQQRLTEEHPAVGRYSHDLAATYNNIAGTHRVLGEYDEALISYKESIKVRKQQLARADLAAERMALGSTLRNVARLFTEQSDWSGALSWLDQSIDTLENLRSRVGEDERLSFYLYSAYRDRAESLMEVGQPAKAVEDWRKSWEFSPEAERNWLAMRGARARAQSGDYIQAVEEANELRTKPIAADTKVLGAAVYSRAAAAVRDDKSNVNLTEEERENLKTRFGQLSLELLREAREEQGAAFSENHDEVMEHADFEFVRSLDGFKDVNRALEMPADDGPSKDGLNSSKEDESEK